MLYQALVVFVTLSIAASDNSNVEPTQLLETSSTDQTQDGQDNQNILNFPNITNSYIMALKNYKLSKQYSSTLGGY